MKKFIKKLAKKAEGFTLVELVVVIAILGILAGVAVPAYSGYLQKANDTACLSELEALEVAAQSATSLNGKTVSSIVVDKDGNITVDPAAGTGEVAYTEFYKTTAATLKDLLADHSEFKTKGATWTPADDWKKTP